MGTDLYMESRNAPCPKPSDAVKALEEAHETLRARLATVATENSRLASQAVRDGDTIVRLTRENDRLTREDQALRAQLRELRDEIASNPMD